MAEAPKVHEKPATTEEVAQAERIAANEASDKLAQDLVDICKGDRTRQCAKTDLAAFEAQGYTKVKAAKPAKE